MSNDKKQVPLRLSKELYDQLNNWAKDDFRSLNGQIEYLLTACVRSRKKNGHHIPGSFEPIEPLAGDLEESADETK
ncbi:MAG: PTS ascorbate transporter subunit IIC [Clostridiaceae bacterium]